VAVEVAAGAVAVLGGAWVGVAGEDWASRIGTPASRASVIAAWRREWGLMCRGMSATLAMRATIRQTSRRFIGLPETGRRISGPDVRWPRQASSTRRTGTVTGMVAGLLPFPTRRCAAATLRTSTQSHTRVNRPT
jgi:hypothetical protein